MQGTVLSTASSQYLPRLRISSFFQSALLRQLQPFSVMLFSPEYNHSYWGVAFSGAATVPSRVVRSLYLRFCCCLIYILITEAEVFQSANVGLAEGDTPLLFNAVVPCIKRELQSNNLISSAVVCLSSFFSTSQRTAERLEVEILLCSESVDGYASSKYDWLRVHNPLF